eukprot:GHVU01119750.1.p1 GENE.GHVU01119750.1~~GHVU01119750.1.p1  ORF type:complete len:324 (-),score=21.95 GHVU01119750.1:434-1405(-)
MTQSSSLVHEPHGITMRFLLIALFGAAVYEAWHWGVVKLLGLGDPTIVGYYAFWLAFALSCCVPKDRGPGTEESIATAQVKPGESLEPKLLWIVHFVAGAAACLVMCHLPPSSKSIYMASIIWFHLSEYHMARRYHPSDTSFEDTLLNNSREYTCCILISLVEHAAWENFYWLLGKDAPYEFSTVPRITVLLFQTLGGVGAVAGLLLRVLALNEAKQCFTHLVAERKVEDHHLVVTGVYRLFRHPGYVGFFLWTIGSQVMLHNGVCLCLYFRICWKFFISRIDDEEMYCMRFFGDEYAAYARLTPGWILGKKTLLDSILFQRE